MNPENYIPKIPKSDLIHGAYYAGRCRNARVARWNGIENKFYHYRRKFGREFIETIKCPEDEPCFDVFVTHALLENPEKEIPFPLELKGVIS